MSWSLPHNFYPIKVAQDGTRSFLSMTWDCAGKNTTIPHVPTVVKTTVDLSESHWLQSDFKPLPLPPCLIPRRIWQFLSPAAPLQSSFEIKVISQDLCRGNFEVVVRFCGCSCCVAAECNVLNEFLNGMSRTLAQAGISWRCQGSFQLRTIITREEDSCKRSGSLRISWLTFAPKYSQKNVLGNQEATNQCTHLVISSH